MTTRTAFLFILAVGSTVILTGARSGSPTPSSISAETIFISQPLPLEADIIGLGIDATELLQKALAKLGQNQTEWMKTKIRQTVLGVDTNFVAEGFLQRGPNQCARLEMNIGKLGYLQIVSDGEVIAQVRNTPGKAPEIVVEHFPNIALPGLSAAENNSDAKEAFLNGRSCGGPKALLQHLCQHLRKGKLQTGMFQGRAVIQVKGELEPAAMATCAVTTTPVRYAVVYLDAKTLWAGRLEWWGRDKIEAPHPLVRIEFLEPKFDQPLSAQACMRMFSYRPTDESAP
jgi:hypothetical protein